jgi:hypothetical protein
MIPYFQDHPLRAVAFFIASAAIIIPVLIWKAKREIDQRSERK